MVRLTEVFRQAAHSRIVDERPPDQCRPDARPRGARRARATSTSSTAEDRSAAWRPPGRPGAAIAFPRRFGFDPIRDIQVLCPMNRGGLGARALNLALQAALNPPGERRIEKFGWTFTPRRQGDADREQLRAGGVQRRSRRGGGGRSRSGEVTVAFDGGRVAYGLGDLDELVLAYAITIHKSQGSEYPAVVIP